MEKNLRVFQTRFRLVPRCRFACACPDNDTGLRCVMNEVLSILSSLAMRRSIVCSLFVFFVMGRIADYTLSADLAHRPNVLLIYTDEHHFNTLGCYGGRVVGTPNIDSIAAKGALCTSFYAATPVCSPSRASLISGKYPQNTGVVQNNLPLRKEIVSFGDILAERGYATGWAGKWHLAGSGKPQWAPEERFGFKDNRYMFNRGHWKKLAVTASGPVVGSKNKKGQADYGLVGVDERSYATDWLTDRAIEFVVDNRDQPFCYVLSLPDPHGPNKVRPPYDTMYVGAEILVPDSMRKPNSAYPAWAPKTPRINPRWLRANLPQYYGMVKCIDDNVGRILDTLRREGLLEKTMIVFTSDHGDLCGEHGRSEKGVPYEGSARIPFIVSYPEVIPPGGRIHEALSTVDVLPTMMGLMGIDVSIEVDGRDASALIRQEKPGDWNDIAFIRSTTGNHWVAAITNDLKLVFSAKDTPWLFDLSKDPQEMTNRIAMPDYQVSIRGLVRELDQYRQSIGDPFLEDPVIRKQIRAFMLP